MTALTLVWSIWRLPAVTVNALEIWNLHFPALRLLVLQQSCGPWKPQNDRKLRCVYECFTRTT